MSESLRNDGRVWVPTKKGDKRPPSQIPEAERDYYLERNYPSFGNLVPRDVASRNAKQVCDEGRGVGETGLAVYLDFRDAIQRLGKHGDQGALRQPVRHVRAHHRRRSLPVPMRIYPAIHYTMGGLWVDYNLMSTIPGLYVIGEANFSDHGANRLGASALMQGLADGYFVLPYTIGDYLASNKLDKIDADHPAVQRSGSQVDGVTKKLLEIKGTRSVDSFHRELGKIMWDYCGMARNADGLQQALAQDPGAARGVLAGREGAGHRRRVEPVAGEGRPRGRFLRIRRADVPAMRWSATNPAAAISARSIRRRKARPRATTRTTPMPRPGSSAA